MTDIELLVDLHSRTPRQGPGSNKDTLKALSYMHLPEEQLKIADIGCGSGSHTLLLAEKLNASITAVDLFPTFLDKLKADAQKHHLSDKITTINTSMEDLPFATDSLDIIWSEGAIYNMGFTKGIQQWRNFLKPGGFLAVSEITWITPQRPKEIEDFWTYEYPEIDTAGSKIKVLESNGYSLQGYFHLPQSTWLDNYYKPLANHFSNFLDRHNHSEAAQETVRLSQEEIALYNRFKDYYSYGFYIARKI